MRRLMTDCQVDNIISSGIEMKGLEIFNNRPTVGSLSDTNKIPMDEMYCF